MACLLIGSSRALASAAVELTWDPSPSSHIVAYKVYVGKRSGDFSLVLTLADVPDVIISDLEEGATYYFAVAAVAASGKESKLSNETKYTVPQPVLVEAPKEEMPPARETADVFSATSSQSSAGGAGVNRGTLSGIHPLPSTIPAGSPIRPQPNPLRQLPPRAAQM